MSHEHKAFLIWLPAMTLFVVTALAATTLYPKSLASSAVVANARALLPPVWCHAHSPTRATMDGKISRFKISS
jgi:hypothetical protein